MEAIKEVRRVMVNDLVIYVPDQFLNKDVEITIKKLGEHKKRTGAKRKVKFDAFRLDTMGFIFNRERANER